jgi:hypothetical protein
MSTLQERFKQMFYSDVGDLGNCWCEMMHLSSLLLLSSNNTG